MIYDAALKQRFPVGTTVGDVVTALEADGYSVISASSYGAAKLSRSNIACSNQWLVGWKSDIQGKIIEIDGDVSSVCL